MRVLLALLLSVALPFVPGVRSFVETGDAISAASNDEDSSEGTTGGTSSSSRGGFFEEDLVHGMPPMDTLACELLFHADLDGAAASPRPAPAREVHVPPPNNRTTA